MTESLTGLTAAELATRIHRREVSAVEVARAHLDRIAEVDGAVHAFLHVAEEAALASATLVDERLAAGRPPASPLAGVPLALKDVFTTVDMPTTAGSKILEGWRPPYDATVTARLRAAGITILGKTNMDEFAMGSSTEHSAYGATRNPWDTERIPGGSGGGSAAALAAFEAPLAIGTDTGGSIRQPAAMTGTVGVKPTYGGVSRYGLIACASSLDQGGPCARTVLDAALLHEVIAGHDPLDSTSIDAPVPGVVDAARLGAGGDLSGVRVGVVRELGGEGYQPGVQASCDAALRQLEKLGAELVEVSCPHFEYGLAAYYLILPSEVSSNLARFDAMRYGLRIEPRSCWGRERRGGDGRDPGGRVRAGGQATDHPRHLRAVLRLLRRLLRAGAEGAHAHRAGLRRGLRAGRRAGLADRADHGVPDRGEGRRPAGHVPQRHRLDPDQPGRHRRALGSVRAGRRRAPGRAADHGPGAGRGRDVPGRRGLRGRPGRRGRRPADPPCPLAAPIECQRWSVLMTAPTLVDYDEVVERFDPTLGLEVHVELNTDTKMFCGCPTTFGAEPNTQVCPVCLGLPGSLPVVNRTAVESAIRIGLALNCTITPWGRFARKNYFYPDMPKNFQTSQYDEPIAVDGHLDLELADGTTVRVGIERAHMEEDTGKSLHVGGATGRIHGAEYSLLDYNRAGVPLIEIVTKTIPGTGARAPEVARAYVTALRDLLRALDVSDVRMEQGSMRCDVNLSLAPRGSGELGTRTETKNVNSLRSVERAVRHEMMRQAGVLLAGDRIVQETRHFEEVSGSTRAGRRKETSEDYRYFPEPDLVPIAPPAEWVRGAARHAARAALAAAAADRRRVVADRRGAARPGQRRCAGADRGHGGRRRAGRRRPVLVGVLPGPAGQHPRRRAGRAADHPGPAGPGDRAGRGRGAEQQAGPPGRRRGAGRRGRPGRGGRGPRAGRGVRRRAPCWPRSTRRWPPSPTWPRRSAAARWRRPARSSAR